MTANYTTTDPSAPGAAAGDAAGQEAIRFEGVSKRFGSTVAVDDLTLSVRRGEFFSLLGPSGCGKTTTLRMVAGFEQPSEGRVYLEGEPVDDVPPVLAERQHGVPELRPVRASRRRRETSRSG